MAARQERSPTIMLVWLIPVSVLAAGFGVGLAITLPPSSLSRIWPTILALAQTPGTAALIALFAGVLAFIGISRQVAVSRASLEHQREVARSDAWWAMFKWVSDRAIPTRPDDHPLPPSVTIRTLEQLVDNATTKIQEAACAGVIDALTPEVDTPSSASFGGDGDDAAEVPSQDQGDAALAALESYVESNRGTSAASRLAEALIYNNSVSKALLALSWITPGTRAFRNPPSESGVDAVVEIDGRRVYVEIKYVRDVGQLRAAMLKSINRFRDGVDPTPLVLVTPLPSPLSPEEEAGHRAFAVQWRGPDDDNSLLAGLRRASDPA